MVSLLLMVIDGSDVVPKLYVDILGGVFAFGRLFHMIGLWSNEGTTVGRLTGGILSLLLLIVAACMATYSAVQPLIQTEDGLSSENDFYIYCIDGSFGKKCLLRKLLHEQ